jgi:glycosyltransferase involved in cell wall biosynthesis
MNSDVVIITKDRPDRIEYAMKQVFRKLDFHKLIVVDGSEILPPVYSKIKSDRFILIHAPNVKLGYARQLGLEKTSTEHVAYFDDDLIYPSTWLKDMLQFIKESPDEVAGASSRIVRAPNLEHPLMRMGLAVNCHKQKGHSGGGCILNRDKVLSVGGWNPYIHRGEDLDLSLRLSSKGFTWIRNGKTFAYHPMTIVEWCRGARANGRAAVYLFQYVKPYKILIKKLIELFIQPFRFSWRVKSLLIIPAKFSISLFSLIGFNEGLREYKKTGSLYRGESKYQ